MNPEWRPDPFGRFEMRFHDGTVWTEHVVNAGIQATDPPVPSAPNLVHLPPPPSMPVPSATGPLQEGPAVALSQVVRVEKTFMCAKHGVVVPATKKGFDTDTRVKRVSPKKVARAIVTGGASLLVIGARSYLPAKTTALVCPHCKREVIER